MSDHTRCKVCRMTHFKDELCPNCGDYEKRVRVLEAEGLTRSDAQGVVDMEGPLPSKDPYVQEFREKRGRVAQEELYPECDPLPNERR